MFNFWQEGQRFILSVNNRDEVIILKEEVRKEVALSFFGEIAAIPCLQWSYKSRFERALKEANQIYDVTTNEQKELVFKLKKDKQ